MKKYFVVSLLLSTLCFTGCGKQEKTLQSFIYKDEQTVFELHDVFTPPTIVAAFSDGTCEIIKSGVSFSGYNMDVVGDYTVTIEYLGLKDEYQISVIEQKYNEDSFLFETQLNEYDPLDIDLVEASEEDCSLSFDVRFSTGYYAVSADDGLFYSDYNEMLYTANDKISAMDRDSERPSYYEKLQKGQVSPDIIDNCYVGFDGSSYKTEIVIPRIVNRGEGNPDEVPYFIGLVNKIKSNFFEKTNNKIKTIYIPNTIEVIPEDAFVSGFSLEKIYCEAESKPSGWEDGWNNGVSVVWNYDIYDGNRSELETSHVFMKKSIYYENANYFIGYYPENSEQYPLIIEFVETRSDGKEYKRYIESTKTYTSTYYDSVGHDILGIRNFLSFNITVCRGSKIYFDSLVVHNILRADYNYINHEYVPNYDYPLNGRVTSRISSQYDYIEF